MKDQNALEEYLLHYSYESRKEMKANSAQLLEWLKAGEAQLVDIRFPEEHKAWRTGFALHIPLPELPQRLQELDRDKLIVTACPHKDRAIIAMVYLQTQGYRVKYLTDGLSGLSSTCWATAPGIFYKICKTAPIELPA